MRLYIVTCLVTISVTTHIVSATRGGKWPELSWKGTAHVSLETLLPEIGQTQPRTNGVELGADA